ncbi:ABC transporter ATP-binding protein [Paenibacillus pinistramenti]|uniref:ABC transporter ATP-binding protein n=1 Tax=Paenibacillus pinistramenti TaxID=1768003 RepID=UPI001108D725|nr:ABC transporter ATP-binding protein [Paenibacillus pinistramenti]
MNRGEISVEDVTYSYNREGPFILDGLSLHIRAGERVHIAGRSGSGKSTLLQLLTGQLPHAGKDGLTGGIRVGGIDPAMAGTAGRAEVISALFQDPDAQLVQGIVEDEIAFGPENMQVPPEEIRQRVEEVLRGVNLVPLRHSRVHELSGGQRQRAAAGAVLSMHTPIVVLDDPFARLDKAAQQQLLSLLDRLSAAGRTVITVSARIDAAAAAAQRLVVLDGGRAVLEGTPAVLLRSGEARARLAALGVLPAAPPSASSASPPRSPSPTASRPSAKPASSPFSPPPSSPAAPSLDSSPPPSSAPASSPPPQPPSAATPADRLLELRGLRFQYPSGAEALRGVSLHLGAGQMGLLCGENGSGKTTLSRLLIGLLRAPKGMLFLDGMDIGRMKAAQLARHVGYVFQEPAHQFVTGSVLEEMLFEPLSLLKLRVPKQWQGDAGSRLEWAQEQPALKPYLERAGLLLREAGLSSKAYLSPYLLSGGEQRLLGAVVQFMVPKLLYVLDEPTAGTDFASAGLLARLCRQAADEGAGLLLITHEPELFNEYADIRFQLDKGRLR